MAHATDVRGQERTLDLSVGRIVFDYAPATTPAPTLSGTPSHASITFRENRSTGTWMMVSAAVPTADDAMAWAVAGASHRRLWPAASTNRTRAAGGVSLTGQTYTFRQPGHARLGFGGVGDARGLMVVPLGRASIEAQVGWRGQALTFAGASSRRGVFEAGARAIIPGTMRIEAESKWVRATDGLFPFAGATVFVYGRSPVYAWLQAGQWFGSAPFDGTSWSGGLGVTVGGRSRVWMNVRQDAPDPLYRNAERRTWMIGVTRVLGTAPRPRAVGAAASDGRIPVVVRIRVADAPAGQVEVAGAFNGWQPQPMAREGDEWVIRLRLSPGVYDYAFRSADGSWFVPMSSPGRRSDGMGGLAAVLVVP